MNKENINIEKINDESQLEIVSKDKILNELELNVTAIVIENEKQYGKATELLKSIKTQIKDTEKLRKDFTSPINNFIKSINDKFRPVAAKAEKIRNILELKIIEYHKVIEASRKIEAEKIRQAELKRLEQKRIEAEKIEIKKAAEEQRLNNAASYFLDEEPENVEIDNEASKQIEEKIEEKSFAPIKFQVKFKTDKVTTTIRKTWTYEILDHLDVPVEWCSPDHKKITEGIGMGVRTIPGLRIFEKESVISR